MKSFKKALQIYLHIQIALAGLAGVYVFYNYNKQEPVTLLLVETTGKVLSHKAGFCSDQCFQDWQSSIQDRPYTQMAIKKMVRWIAKSPTAGKFVLGRLDEGQKKQLIMLTTLSSLTPESIAQFESLYGISPATLRDLLLNQNTR